MEKFPCELADPVYFSAAVLIFSSSVFSACWYVDTKLAINETTKEGEPGFVSWGDRFFKWCLMKVFTYKNANSVTIAVPFF